MQMFSDRPLSLCDRHTIFSGHHRSVERTLQANNIHYCDEAGMVQCIRK